MGRAVSGLVVFICVVACSAAVGQALSPSVLVANSDGSRLFIAEETAKQVVSVAVPAGKIEKAVALQTAPTGLALSADGATLYVTTDGPAGKVQVVDAAAGKVTKTIAAGHTPMAPALSPDGKLLYVCNRFNNNVAVVDLGAGKEVARIPVLREPVAAAVSQDGKLLFVANHLPTGAADGDYISAAVSVIDTAARKVVKTIALPNGSTGLRGLCLSPDGAHVYATHILARYHMPTTQLERGWMNTNALSVVDVAKQELVNTVLLDDVDLGAANPWDVVCSADGRWICVSQAGTHEVAVVDRAAMHEKLTKVAKGEKVSVVSQKADDVPNDLSFLVGIKRRLRLAGNGPRGVAMAGNLIYTCEYYTDSLGVVNPDPETRHRPKSLPLGPKVEMDQVRRGEMLFNDATICFQHWQSCASCHPDARTDALNWDLLNDGMGNPKQTKSMLLAHKTPPAMVSGIRGSAEVAVRAGIRFILFAVRPEEDANAMDAYLKSLEPVPSPYLVDGKLSKAAKRGEKVFRSAGCARCHPKPLYTDMATYDLGLGRNLDKDRKFDTPTLVENWRSGPFLYDGRAATMEDVLVKHNADNLHGRTSSLSEKDLADVAEFVLSQ